MTPPDHLAKFDLRVVPFEEDERIFRRCYVKNHNETRDIFSLLQWDHIYEGWSTNRSKWSQPEDILWAPVEENNKCRFEPRDGVVIETLCKIFPLNDPKTGVGFALNHTPINCNISHCDMTGVNLPARPGKTKTDIKAFLASFFRRSNLALQSNGS